MKSQDENEYDEKEEENRVENCLRIQLLIAEIWERLSLWAFSSTIEQAFFCLHCFCQFSNKFVDVFFFLFCRSF